MVDLYLWKVSSYVSPHVSKMLIHCSTIWKVVGHARHQLAETGVGGCLVIKDNKKWSHQVTHALHVACVQVLPHIPDRWNIHGKGGTGMLTEYCTAVTIRNVCS